MDHTHPYGICPYYDAYLIQVVHICLVFPVHLYIMTSVPFLACRHFSTLEKIDGYTYTLNYEDLVKTFLVSPSSVISEFIMQLTARIKLNF